MSFARKKISRIPRLFTTVQLVLFSFALVLTSYAQEKKLISAVVVVKVDYLRSAPERNAPIKRSVVRGIKLHLIATSTPGWYFGSEVGSEVYGYIHKVSFRDSESLANTKTKKPATDGNIRPPKYIILDTAPDITEETIEKKRPAATLPLASNQCLLPLFCPDAGDIYNALRSNEDKFSKGKFEKTLDWEKRMLTVLHDVKIGNGKTAAEKMVFLYEQGTGSLVNYDATYDADEEKWTFPLLFRKVDKYSCIPVASRAGELLCLVTPVDISFVFNAEVRMSTAAAKTNDGKLQLAFVGKVIAPYLWSDRRVSSTYADIYTGIHFELEEIICLNPKSGQRWKVEYKNLNSQ
ncbi:MAG: hypothetical protein WKF92_13885 [Pyrinomonadaceae bacterium]